MPVVDIQVSAGTDDVEERLSGSVNLSSSDLEMADDETKYTGQTIRLRFNNLDIRQDGIITNTYIQFQADETNSGAISLQIYGEDTNNAAAFVDEASNVSSRQSTTATVDWRPPDWTTTGEAGIDQRTADISAIIQEIVNRPGWAPTNSIAPLAPGLSLFIKINNRCFKLERC